MCKEMGKLDYLFSDMDFLQGVLIQDSEDELECEERVVADQDCSNCDWIIPSWEDKVVEDWDVDENLEWEDVPIDWD